jgi:hypothetical protein
MWFSQLAIGQVFSWRFVPTRLIKTGANTYEPIDGILKGVKYTIRGNAEVIIEEKGG